MTDSAGWRRPLPFEVCDGPEGHSPPECRRGHALPACRPIIALGLRSFSNVHREQAALGCRFARSQTLQSKGLQFRRLLRHRKCGSPLTKATSQPADVVGNDIVMHVEAMAPGHTIARGPDAFCAWLFALSHGENQDLVTGAVH